MRTLPLIAILASLVAGASHAQDASDRERETRGFRMATYDLPPAETLAARGDQAVRVYIDGAFSGWLPALVLEKPRGHAPSLEVIGGRWEGGLWRRLSLSAPIPVATWQRLAAAGGEAVADWQALEVQRAKPPLVKPESVSDIVVCTDGQDSVVETADADGRVGRAAEHDCEFTELGDFADALSAEAMTVFAPCAGFTGPVTYGNLQKLQLCLLADGDRRAALAAETVAFGPDRRDLPRQASDDVVADWAGKPRTIGKAAFAALWSGLSLQALHFQVDSAHGVGPDRAVLKGAESYLAHPDDQTYQQADCTQTWVRSHGRWRLTRLEVGAFHPYEPAHDPRKPT